MEHEAPLSPEEARLRPTYAVVHLSGLRANLAAIKTHVGPARVMAILKANAYGHGLAAVARALAPQADAFGVALVEEGIALRRLGIENPILVFGGTWTRQIPLFLEHGLALTVPSLARLRDVEEAAAARGSHARVHLKIDTGMERIGVHYYNAEGLARGRGALAPRRGRGHLLPLRQRRCRGPHGRPTPARPLRGGAALLRAAIAPRSHAPHGELRRPAPDAGEPSGPRAPGHPPLWCVSVRGRAADG